MRWPSQNEQTQAGQPGDAQAVAGDVRSGPEPSRSPEWIPVTFKFTEETPDGPPGRGIRGRSSVRQWRVREDQHEAITGSRTQRHGRFRRRPAGDWEYSSPGAGASAWNATGRLNVDPGQPGLKEIVVCPRSPPSRVAGAGPCELAGRAGRAELALVAVASVQRIRRIMTYQPLVWMSGARNGRTSVVGGWSSQARPVHLWPWTALAEIANIARGLFLVARSPKKGRREGGTGRPSGCPRERIDRSDPGARRGQQVCYVHIQLARAPIRRDPPMEGVRSAVSVARPESVLGWTARDIRVVRTSTAAEEYELNTP